jgi:hypothetical protein
MKRIIIGLGTIFLALSLGAMGQVPGGPGPHAWGDKNKDGKCDITGQPVGQGRGSGKRAMGQGNGCRGRGQQNGCCRRGQGAAPQATPSQETQK